ncbi:RagB/SusD family nutrient uptake outer membrane protein [Coprobacter secundus]|uniref:Carbohydrate-binding protein n=1 Tax=Coprobacter secundus subsp. similis TaxID=2751153 RepID=A0A7G1HTK2_9BACT|nr:RagB/SusD family nutrient uptake outer membrane protein [Coprobacter secundus]BCI61851.1 carbohydrate-binding protein [Coprobacter secundus subsp. similis]
MKKKLLYTCIAASFALSLGSCSDVMDVTPDGRLSLEEVFANPDYTAAYFSQAFDNLPHKMMNYYWFDNLPSALSDESWSCDDVEGVGAINAYKGQGSARENLFETCYNENFECQYWERYWKSIRTINVFLQNIPTAAVNSETDRSRMTAEAHVLRAYYYLQLIKWYGALPIIKVPFPDDADYSTVKKSSAVDCLKFVVEDCETAMLCEDLPWRIVNDREFRRLTRAMAAAIRSQAALYAASPLYNTGGENLWDYAYEKNKDSYQKLKANGYELYTQQHHPDEYPNAYSEYFVQNATGGANPIDRETIWLDIKDNWGMWWVWGLPIQSNYRAGCVPSQELVDAYDMLETGKPVLDLKQPYLDETHLQPNYTEGSGYNPARPYEGRDPRFYATVIYNGASIYVGNTKSVVQTYNGGNSELRDNDRRYTRTGYYLNKYRNWQAYSGLSGQDGKWKHYRMGEVYLNLAEAAIEAGHIDEGLALINDIRHRAGFDPSVDVTATTQEEARLLLRHERQVEFAFEEHRFFDTRRWTRNEEDLENEKFCTGMRAKRSGLKLTYERFIVGSDGSSPSKLSYKAKWHFLPIPIDDVSSLEDQTGDRWQNYGW